jgi:hypothetical protein
MFERGGFNHHLDPERQKATPKLEKAKKDSFNPYESTAKLNKKDLTSESGDSATDKPPSTADLAWAKKQWETALKHLPSQGEHTRKLEDPTSEADTTDRPIETKTFLPENKTFRDRSCNAQYRLIDDHLKHLKGLNSPIDAH